ncbi:MAG: helix-turn-helix transcriptional regulator [Clostridia bacterium]|nr:helix-turn-helix transcriptional regulator [Clostridia bacterium]
MKAFYELYRDSDDKLIVSHRTDYSFPAHFHAAIEIMVLLEGEYEVVIDKKRIVATKKSVIIVDSFCIHSFNKLSSNPSKSMLLIIPSNYLMDYNNQKNKKTLACNITQNVEIVDEIKLLAELIIAHEDNEYIKQKYANVILALLIDTIGLTETQEQNSVVIIKTILEYIENNYRTDITLNSIAKHFGYSACYISRLFHSFFNISISRYINNLRIKYVEMNKGSSEKISHLIYDSGFQSPQTYYRNLKYYNSNKN